MAAREVFVLTSFRERALSACSQAGLVNNLNDGMAWGLFPLLFARGGLSVAAIGVLVALYPAVWGLGQPLTGALSDRVGRKPLIVWGMLLQAGGYTEADAELVKTGGFGEGIAALDSGQIDVAAITEPLWSKVKNKYRAVVVASEVLPPLDNVVGVTTVEMAEKRGDFIRAVIRARRKAVQFMIAHPDEAAEIVAKQYNIELDVAKSAVRNLTTSKTKGVPYWGEGQIHMEGLKRMIEAQLSGHCATHIDEVFHQTRLKARALFD